MYVILNFKRDQFIEPQSKHSVKVKVFTITVKLLCVSAFHTSQLAPLKYFPYKCSIILENVVEKCLQR